MGHALPDQTPPADAMLEMAPNRLTLRGGLTAPAVSRLWNEAMRAAPVGGKLTLDVAGVTSLDTAGAVFLLRLAERSGDARFDGPTDPGAKILLDRNREALERLRPPAPEVGLPVVAQLGAGVVEEVRDAGNRVAFVGETLVAALGALRHPRRIRLGETLRHLDEAGLRAFALTVLLGFLIGLILAFQSSIPMRQFGAEIFIPNLVGLSLTRELGPLMAAVILSGRTGSAYAAELGTMVVNEEVDALRIMGIDPMAWLVLPRIAAAILVMPILALLMDLAGLIGMTGVMLTLGFPTIAVINQLQAGVGLGDVLGGLAKAAMFGLAIGLVACRAGLGAGRGPRAVGDAATSAVVGGIVSIVLLDGVFAILFFRLGL